jgi:hypothetical protein
MLKLPRFVWEGTHPLLHPSLDTVSLSTPLQCRVFSITKAALHLQMQYGCRSVTIIYNSPNSAVKPYHLLTVADPPQFKEIPICPPPDRVF